MPGQYNNFCRLCLAESDRLTSVFTANATLDVYISSIFAVEIQVDDPYSRKICWSCLQFVIQITKKRLEFRQNDHLLKESSRARGIEDIDSTDCTVSSTEEDNSTINKDTTELSANDVADQLISSSGQEFEVDIHPSVSKLLKKEVTTRIPENLWHMNFDAHVRVEFDPASWPRETTNSTTTNKKRKRKTSTSTGSTEEYKKLLKCSEENWDFFFNNYYQQTEQNDSKSEEENLEPLSALEEQKVYLCKLCQEVSYDLQDYQKHVLTHGQKSEVINKNRSALFLLGALNHIKFGNT